MGTLYLIRHGQASFGAAHYDQLSDLGFEQARHVGMHLKERLSTTHKVFRGDMQRHDQTATACLEAMGFQGTVHVHKGLNEYDFEEIIERYNPRYADRSQMAADIALADNPQQMISQIFESAVARWVQGAHDSDYTEPWHVFKARCQGALHDMARSLGKDETALAFTSGGAITAMVQPLIGVEDAHAFKLNWGLANGSISKVLVKRRGLMLGSLNEHGHFEGRWEHLLTFK